LGKKKLKQIACNWSGIAEVTAFEKQKMNKVQMLNRITIVQSCTKAQ